MNIDKYLNEGSDRLKVANFLSKVDEFRNDLHRFSGSINFENLDLSSGTIESFLESMNELDGVLGEFKADLLYLKTGLI
jgi:hypothetical protein